MDDSDFKIEVYDHVVMSGNDVYKGSFSWTDNQWTDWSPYIKDGKVMPIGDALEFISTSTRHPEPRAVYVGTE